MIRSKKIRNLSDISESMEFDTQLIPIMSSSEEEGENVVIPDIIPILTLRSSVLFPGAITPITIGRDKSIKLIKEIEEKGMLFGAVLQRDGNIEEPDEDDLYRVGTVARLLKVLEMPNGNLTAILHGVEKFEITKFITKDPYFTASIVRIADSSYKGKDNMKYDALIDSVRDIAINIVNLSPNIPNETIFAIKNLDSNRGIINFVSSNIDFDDNDRQMLLEAPGVYARANRLLELLLKEQQLLKIKNELQQRVKQDIDTQQREYFLQQQLRTIQEELGQDEEEDINNLRAKAEKKLWKPEVKATFEKELAKLERMNPAVAEYSVQINYLELMLDLPWDYVTKDNLNLNTAMRRLNKDHFGMEDVKERIIEYLAVLKLKGDLKSPILCLYGPPGVGKTSLGKSVADALGRKYGRVSLGGMHDEAEIRGHRRTYIGAMAGRIIQTIRKCGSSNPVIILDEIDKVGAKNNGDPASALLEVLDPEQNTTFHDNYLDIEYDLSKVLFIATANDTGTISNALRDRMEMINVSGYLLEEKVQIAKKHLVSKEAELNGVDPKMLKMSGEIIAKIISEYTRESGVRALDKKIAKITRCRAKEIGMNEEFSVDVTPELVEKYLGVPRYKYDIYEGNDNIGVVTGLAWTQVGGDILFIESSLSKGKGNLSMTGSLGDVMKESATIAHQWVKSHSSNLGISDEMMNGHDVHIHVPEGATPKDGPSAGITIVTSLVSAYTGRKVREKVAMSGETTLRGKVLPVGGLKEKILAAKRAGLTDIIICRDNKKDISEINEKYIKGITFHYVDKIDEVLKIALL